MAALPLWLCIAFLSQRSDAQPGYGDYKPSTRTDKCWHFFDKPIDVCFSVNTNATGLTSFKYKCNTNSSEAHYYVTLDKYNSTETCLGDAEESQVVYNFTAETFTFDEDGMKEFDAKGTNLTEYVSCNGYKPCAYFKGRYYITLELTDAPTSAPTHSPTHSPTMSPTDVPTATNKTAPPSPDPTGNPTMEPTWDPTYIPTLNPTFKNETLQPSRAPSWAYNWTHAPTASPTRNYTTLNPEYPFLANETCARAQDEPLSEYWQDIIYITDQCLPYSYIAEYNGTNLSGITNENGWPNSNGWFPGGSMFTDNDTQAAMAIIVSDTNDSVYISRTCHEDAFGNPLSISSALYLS